MCVFCEACRSSARRDIATCSPEVMPSHSLLGGVPAAVVCCHQVQVPSCKGLPEGLLVLSTPQGRADHMCCSDFEVWIPAAA